jgi:peptidoglycan hydrolase CwlO-like protein
METNKLVNDLSEAVNEIQKASESVDSQIGEILENMKVFYKEEKEKLKNWSGSSDELYKLKESIYEAEKIFDEYQIPY